MEGNITISRVFWRAFLKFCFTKSYAIYIYIYFERERERERERDKNDIYIYIYINEGSSGILQSPESFGGHF